MGKKEAVNVENLHYVDNDEYNRTGELASLSLALDKVFDHQETLIVSYGDVLYKKYILQLLLDDEQDLAIVVDSEKNYESNLIRRNYVAYTLPNPKASFYNDVYLKNVSRELPKENLCGMWTGLLKVANKLKPEFILFHLFLKEIP